MRNGEQRAARGLTGYQFWNVRPLCLAALGFCLGICLCFYVRISAWGWLMAGCAALFLCMLWLLYTGRRGFFVCLVLITAGLGMLRTIPALRGVPLVWPKEGKIEGVICDFQQSDGVFTLLLKEVEINGRQTGECLRVRTKSANMQQARPGDGFCGTAFSIWMAESKSALDKIQRYANHWDKLAWVGEDVSIIRNDAAWAYWPARARRKVAERIEMLFGGQADLVKGMLLGDKTGLSEQTRWEFQQTGISHILAVSGLHVGFLAALIIGALHKSKLKPKTQAAVLLGVLWSYCALVGFPASAVRATVMASVHQTVQAAGRRTDLLESLSIAALVLLVFDPLQMLLAGFQLSFAAVWGIGTITQALVRRCKKGPTRLINSLSTSLGAQLGIWPVSLQYFQGISVISVLANLIVVPLASMITSASFLALFLSVIWPALAMGFAKLINGIVLLLTYCTAWMARIPFALCKMPPWPPSAILLFLASLFCLSPYCLWKAKDRWMVVIACWAVALGLTLL